MNDPLKMTQALQTLPPLILARLVSFQSMPQLAALDLPVLIQLAISGGRQFTMNQGIYSSASGILNYAVGIIYINFSLHLYLPMLIRLAISREAVYNESWYLKS